MTDTDTTERDADDGAVTPPDPCVSLSVRFPLTLDPMYRQVDGLVLMAWAIDTGEALFCRKLKCDDLDDVNPAALITEKLPRLVPFLLVAVYDGDDGGLRYTSTVKPPVVKEGHDRIGNVGMSMALSMAAADPDQPCTICDDAVPEGADYSPADVHPECLLTHLIGPLGHHLDHRFWCENMGDPHCGRGVRQAALDLHALVETYGLPAILAGEFPHDNAPDNGTNDA